VTSRALHIWQNRRSKELDEIERAHHSIEGSGRGRRFATEQLNNAYMMLLSAQFQGFCRDLHSECIDHLLSAVAPGTLQRALRLACIDGRSLNKGNPNRDNLQRDFSRLGFNFDPIFASGRNERLSIMNKWRNAISHQDFNPLELGGRTKLRLAEIRDFRRLCNRLAGMMDKSACRHIKSITGQKPWP
jgi:hypothetical protein